MVKNVWLLGSIRNLTTNIAITWLNRMFHFTGPYEYYTPPSKYISQEPTYQEHPYHQLVHKKPGILESLKSMIFSKLGINRQSAIGNRQPSQDLSYYQQGSHQKTGFLEGLKSKIFSKLGINRQATQVSPVVLAIFAAVATAGVGVALGKFSFSFYLKLLQWSAMSMRIKFHKTNF